MWPFMKVEFLKSEIEVETSNLFYFLIFKLVLSFSIRSILFRYIFPIFVFLIKGKHRRLAFFYVFYLLQSSQCPRRAILLVHVQCMKSVFLTSRQYGVLVST